MITACLIISIINFLMLLSGAVYYFKNHYIILDIETYNTLAETYNQAIENKEASQNLAGGCGIAIGYNADYLLDDEEGE